MHKKHKTKENFPRSSALYYLLSVLCYLLSVLCYLYSKALPASLVLRRGRIDKDKLSQPARHHILRCCVRPFAVVLVDKTQLTTCVFRDPRGATYAALRVTYRYAHCRLLVVAEELLKHILLFQLFCVGELTRTTFRNPHGIKLSLCL